MKTFLTVFFCVFYTGISYAQSQKETSTRLDLQISGGWRHQDFGWSIAGDNRGNHPNVLSELKWKELAGPELTAQCRYQLNARALLRFQGGVTLWTKGSVYDTDYQRDDRTDPAYQAQFSGKGGYRFHCLVSAGYALVRKHWFTVYGWAGISVEDQLLKIQSAGGDSLYLTEGLLSTYRATGLGPVLGLETEIAVTPELHLIVEADYMGQSYLGNGNWNLVPLFRHPHSFEQQAWANRWRLQLKGVYHFCPNWGILGQFCLDQMQTGAGEDALYLSNGTTLLTRFNGAQGSSAAWGLGVFHRF
jgi:Protochlamydia outer membrane protein